MSVDNMDQFVYPSNALSTKVLQLQCKAICIDDTMQVVKKGYDKDTLSLDDYLKYIRQLAKKQARQQIKLNKLLKSAEPVQMHG